MPTRPRFRRVAIRASALAGWLICAHLSRGTPVPRTAAAAVGEATDEADTPGSLGTAPSEPGDSAIVLSPSIPSPTIGVSPRSILLISLRSPKYSGLLSGSPSSWDDASLDRVDLSDPRAILKLLGASPADARFETAGR